MPKLPQLKFQDHIRKSNHINFGGYNHTASARNGDIYDMGNMSSRKYPLLSPRPARFKIGQLETPNGYYVHDDVYTVDGQSFYVNGTAVGTLTNSRKQFAAIGNKVIVMPDWKYYNRDNGEFIPMGASNSETLHSLSDDTTFIIENLGNSEYRLYCSRQFIVISLTPNDNIEISERSLLVNSKFMEINFRGTVVSYANTEGLYVLTARGSMDYTYTPSGSMPAEPWNYDFGNYTYTVTKISPIFIPTAIFECNNRLWACYGDTIRCSKLGDPTAWETYQGLSTDSWTVDVGSAGDFTGGINYRGYPTFFKEDRIYRIYGSYPAQFQCVENATSGLLAGCNGSLREVGEVLYYLSPTGVTAYTGSTPQNISAPFGLDKFSDATAGTDGIRFFISMHNDTQNRYELYAYDTRYGTWHKEGNEQIISFAYNEGLIMLKSDGNVWLNGDSRSIPVGSTVETNIVSYAEFADFIEGPSSNGINSAQPNIKGISKIQIRITVGASSSVILKISYDGGTYETIKTLTTTDKHNYYLPVIPRRCDHFRLKFEAVGDWTLDGLAIESYTGSELY